MATNIAIVKKYAGGRDVWGGRGVMFFVYTGPTSYQGGAAGGDIVDSFGGPGTTQFGGSQTNLRTIEAIIPTISASGTYEIVAGPSTVPSSSGAPKRWLLRWRTFSTGA